MSSPFFEGDVRTAIEKAKKEKKILLVTVQALNDPDCTKLDEETWKDNRVISSMTQHAISLRLLWDTDIAKQFYSIYPCLKVPTIYFIGDNGQALKVLVGFNDANALISSLEEVKQAHDQHLNQTNTSNTSSTSNRESNTMTNEMDTTNNEPISSTQDLDTSASTTNNEEMEIEASQELNENQNMSKEEKLQKYKALAAKKREQRQQEEEEAERKREIERRNFAKEAQQTLKKLEEQKRLRELEERKKERTEEAIARKRIKEKIKMDALERKNRQQTEKAKQTSPILSSTKKANYDMAAIQFKLSNGDVLKHQFKASDTLETCRRYVASNIQRDDFLMKINFPNKTFQESEMKESLRELDLVPSGTIIISYGEDQPSSASSFSSSDISNTPNTIFSFLAPVYSILDAIKSYIWPPEPQQQSANTSSTSSPSFSSRNSRARGNIHRLSDSKQEDDENNWWNGNSTQQKPR